ncbi:MAG: hypothetical protein Q8N53_13680, partial [Longimicrobiales bacterium]|nr:hypothetical protein [Longimicrobiales bacterium]
FTSGGRHKQPSPVRAMAGRRTSRYSSRTSHSTAPTFREIAACDAARTQYAEVMARWEALNARRR